MMVRGDLLVDTDVLIDVLRGHGDAVDWIRLRTRHVVVSVITIAELYAGIKGSGEKQSLEDLIGLFQILPVTAEIARQGGLFRQQFRPSHGTGLADALIAATAVEQRAQLVTLNIKHFPMLDNVETPYRKTH
jgi:predicted nucleic acid-binding protein